MCGGQAELVHFSVCFGSERAGSVVGILWFRFLSVGSLRNLGYPGAVNYFPYVFWLSLWLGVRLTSVRLRLLHNQQEKGITCADKNCYVLRSTSGFHDILLNQLANRSPFDTALLQRLVEPAFYRLKL